MHSHGLTSQPITIIRVCCRRVDRVRPLVGFSCYAILGEIWLVLLLLAGLEVDSSLPYSMLPGKGESIPLFPRLSPSFSRRRESRSADPEDGYPPLQGLQGQALLLAGMTMGEIRAYRIYGYTFFGIGTQTVISVP